ncbi:FAD-dependent oxidoreductase [Streptomyces sp. SL13]|uniref:FAD-dependent oxidoreductase n=1 Tax=Streptantibioticus silvisoli TaxID=2705255 RepID=A0AA90HAV8_9ACTN|nr:FAD-dependent oxidoreductase [Streptantibioticus silvisoli]MDI5971332.1 FAD-dependent oxidoreductase [Streptantibioticus silvisoli]
MKETVRILVVGGGYVGMYTALRLQRRLRAGEAEVTVLTPDPYMTYQPFLAEAAAGSIAAAHVVVPLRSLLDRCTVIVGEAHRVDHARRTVTASTLATRYGGGGDIELPYDELVLVPGSVSRTLPVPGLAEAGIGFKTMEEAIGLRNHVLHQLDIASTTRDVETREAALTFLFVGGGFAGVNALAELEDMARYATRYVHNITADDMRWILVEAADRILPEVGATMSEYVVRELRGRNIDVRLGTRLDNCEKQTAVLDDGTVLPTRTVVWTAGVKPHPLLAGTDLPLTGAGRLKVTATLQVDGTEHAWSAGDAAAVPDLAADPDGATACAPNAQHAVRQAKLLADNLVAGLRGAPQAQYRHAYVGSVASLGLHKGVAHLYGRKLKGYPAWLMHRAFHLSRVPTFNRKARVVADWTLAALVKREVAALGSLENPRAAFESAARGDHPPQE